MDNDIRPIYVVGRQHSGNTMIARIFANVPGVLSMAGEGNFFELFDPDQTHVQSGELEQLLQVLQWGSDDSLSTDEIHRVRQALRERAREKGTSMIDLYCLGMETLCQVRGCQRWLQKATSYVFYAERIFTSLPGARLVFMLRNPLDLAASHTRRGHPERMLRMILGWNKGVRRARRLAAEYPDQFLIVRYEDFVSDPESETQTIFDFVEEPFQSEYLKIPHVNPSEDPYETSDDQSGISQDRIFYFQDELPASQLEAVLWLAGGSMLGEFYPELDEYTENRSLIPPLSTASIGYRGLKNLLVAQGQKFVRHPLATIDRIKRRIF